MGTPGTGNYRLHEYAVASIAPVAAMAALLVQAQAYRRGDPTYSVPRWLRRGAQGTAPMGTDPWTAAQAADLARGTWTTIVGDGRRRRVERRAGPGCPEPPSGPMTREEWGVLVYEALMAGAEARALAGDTSPLVEVVALLARWSATDRAMAAGEVSALLAGLQARAVGDDEGDGDGDGDPAQPRGPPEGRDREFAPAPAVRRLVAAPRRETVPWRAPAPKSPPGNCGSRVAPRS